MCLENLPEYMEQSYERVVRVIEKPPKPQRELAPRVVTYAERSLQLSKLTYAHNDMKSAIEWYFMAHTAESLVANLIVVDIAASHLNLDTCTVRFVHPSVREFLFSNSPNPDILRIHYSLSSSGHTRIAVTK